MPAPYTAGTAPSATTRGAGGSAGGAGPIPGFTDDPKDLLKTLFAPEWPVKVGNLSMAGILALVVLTDGLQAALVILNVLPFIGTAFAFMASFILGATGIIVVNMAFALCGVSFISGKRALPKALALLGPLATELAPFFSAIPALTFGAISTFVMSRFDDREKHFEKLKAEARMNQARMMEAARQAEAARGMEAAGNQAAWNNAAAEAEGEAPEQQGAVIDLSQERERRRQAQARTPFGEPGLPTELPLPNYDATQKQAAGAKSWS